MRKMWLCLVLVLMNASVTNTQKANGGFGEENIFLITLDGFRWQELFGGADSSILFGLKGKNGLVLREKFWSENSAERRRKLLPFFWDSIAAKGQVYGNRNFGNKMNVANPYALSYPGYNEIFTGSVDLSIWDNSPIVNDNTSFLQELSVQDQYRGKVAAFGSWNMFSRIFNKERARFPIITAGTDPSKESVTHNDGLTFRTCMQYIKEKLPSVVFLGFSGTDDAGHEGDYHSYLQQAQRADQFIASLWRMLQQIPKYAGRTTFILTTDHGRGNQAQNWKDHGFDVPGSSQTWMAMMGPQVVPAGEMKGRNQLYQKYIKRLVYNLLAVR